MKCINHKNLEAKARGLCNSCHTGIMTKINAGVLTDAQAVERGMILARKPRGRKREIKPFPRTSSKKR